MQATSFFAMSYITFWIRVLDALTNSLIYLIKPKTVKRSSRTSK